MFNGYENLFDVKYFILLKEIVSVIISYNLINLTDKKAWNYII